jgi:hypothetical protein
MRTLRALLLATIVALPAAGGAADVQLQVLDRGEQTSPPVALATAPCRTITFSDNTAGLSPNHVAIASEANADVQGGDCDSTATASASQFVDVTIIGAPGATAQICYVVRWAAATAAGGSGTVDATARVGGSPSTDPGGVFQNGNPVATFQEDFAANQADSETQRALFTVTVGDVIRLESGVRAFASVVGAGAARSDAEASAALYVDGCPAERAPAASPWGLLALAAALATAGAAVLRRRA